MNALLVYPRFPVTYWGFQYGMHLIGKQAALPPLGLLTVAALLPKDWNVRLVDLNVRALHDDDLRWAELVLTGGLLIQTRSMQEVIARAVAFELPVAVGGPSCFRVRRKGGSTSCCTPWRRPPQVASSCPHRRASPT